MDDWKNAYIELLIMQEVIPSNEAQVYSRTKASMPTR